LASRPANLARQVLCVVWEQLFLRRPVQKDSTAYLVQKQNRVQLALLVITRALKTFQSVALALQASFATVQGYQLLQGNVQQDTTAHWVQRLLILKQVFQLVT